ncbi:hypothetical protein D3C83_23510 [compost metagenome]
MPGEVEPDFILLGELAGDAEFVEQRIEPHAVQRVEIGPRQFAGAHPVHRRRIGAAPLIGELLPVDTGDALARAERLAVGRHRAAPIDDGAEDIVNQRLDLAHRGPPKLK